MVKKRAKEESTCPQINESHSDDLVDKSYLKKNEDGLKNPTPEPDLSYHLKYGYPRRFEQILFDAMKNSKDGFEALFNAVEEASNQKLYFVQQLVERSQRVNKIVLEQLCNLDRSYYSLPEALEQIQKYKKEQSPEE